MKKVGVVLSGCGVYDGSEIHETVLTLLALSRQGADVLCFAPDKTQAFTQFSHFVYSNATGIRNYCRQRAFGYFADFSNNRLFVLKI